MKRIHIFLATALIAVTGASAQSPPTRAEVKAETRAANARGELLVGEHEVVTPQATSTRTRAQQRAETRVLGAQGQLVAHGDSYNPDVSTSRGTGSDRRVVNAEAAAANKAGTLMKPGN